MKISLRQLLNQGRLKSHKTSDREISNLLKLIRRDIKDARIEGLSNDRRFATAYNAVLQTAAILLYCKGYKPKGRGHHFTVFQGMKEIMGKDYYELAHYFDHCRAKRNITSYTYAGDITESNAKELIKEAEKFLKVLINWLKINYPKLLSNPIREQ